MRKNKIVDLLPKYTVLISKKNEKPLQALKSSNHDIETFLLHQSNVWLTIDWLVKGISIQISLQRTYYWC